MTLKSFEKRGFSVNKEFEVNGKRFIVMPAHNSFKYFLRCLTDGETLLTRANLDTCYNKIMEYADRR